MFQGNVCLITGSSKGIGKACAVEFSKKGAYVIVHYNKDKNGALETARIIKDNHGYCQLVQGDLSSSFECKKVVDSVINNAGKIDILVNNAGISISKPFIFTSEDDVETLVNTNINSFLYTSYYASKHMIKNSHGIILNIGSIWGEVGASNEVIYSLTKGAMHAFTKALGKELGPSGVRVVSIAPGVVDTCMNDNLTLDEKNNVNMSIPVGRFASKEEIAKFVVFLASPSASYANAKVFVIDGGIL